MSRGAVDSQGKITFGQVGGGDGESAQGPWGGNFISEESYQLWQ